MPYQRKIFHRDERCLNCDYPLVGNFCGHCGQKAHVHKHNFLHMVFHFFADYFHYDNKFWLTLKTLFLQPGKVTSEFNLGKRVKYLNPIQLYIFVTTICFLFIFNGGGSNKKEKTEPKPAISALNTDSLTDRQKAVVDSIKKKEKDADVVIGDDGVDFSFGSFTPEFNNRKSYDSAQALLSESERDGFIVRYFVYKKYEVDQKYEQSETVNSLFVEKLLHNIPKLFFILLPFFALLLKLAYIRRPYLYIDHIIFSLHFHSVLFISMGLVKIIGNRIPNDNWDGLLFFLLLIGLSFYLFFALKYVYHSPIWKTIIKQIIIFSLYMVGAICAMVIILAITFLSL
ncbi:MAG: DUF3667 domain-containing protein [Chitinophagaceae bacterium]|nr:DUF3667 domain-containing protein [Chitinophagaceae bacterium]